MAIHSSILAWRIPWTEEPGEIQSMGSQRVWHTWSDIAQTHAKGFRGRGSISVPPQHWPASSRKPPVTGLSWTAAGSCQACVPLHVECFVQMGENSSAASLVTSAVATAPAADLCPPSHRERSQRVFELPPTGGRLRWAPSPAATTALLCAGAAPKDTALKPDSSGSHVGPLVYWRGNLGPWTSQWPSFLVCKMQ